MMLFLLGFCIFVGLLLLSLLFLFVVVFVYLFIVVFCCFYLVGALLSSLQQKG